LTLKATILKVPLLDVVFLLIISAAIVTEVEAFVHVDRLPQPNAEVLVRKLTFATLILNLQKETQIAGLYFNTFRRK